MALQAASHPMLPCYRTCGGPSDAPKKIWGIVRASARPPPISTPPLAPTPPAQHDRSRSDLFWVRRDVGDMGRGNAWRGGFSSLPDRTAEPFVATWFTASDLSPLPQNIVSSRRASARPPPLSTPPLAPTPLAQHRIYRSDLFCGKIRLRATCRGKGPGEAVRGPGACPASGNDPVGEQIHRPEGKREAPTPLHTSPCPYQLQYRVSINPLRAPLPFLTGQLLCVMGTIAFAFQSLPGPSSLSDKYPYKVQDFQPENVPIPCGLLFPF